MDRRYRTPRFLGAALLALLPALAACTDDDGPTGPVPGLPPTVLGVQPAIVDAGGSATIRGLNFAPTPSANRVRFGDLEAAVNSASETSLDIQLPAPSELPCRPTQRIPLQVSVAGRSDTVRHRFSVAPSIGLEPGEVRAFLTPDSDFDCREFPASGDEFLISTFNTARSADTRIGFDLVGRPGAGVDDSVRASGSASRTPDSDAALFGSAGLPPVMERVLRADRNHPRMLERNRRIVERGRRSYGDGLPRARASVPDASTPTADRHPRVGEHVQIRVPDLSAGGICRNFVEVTGRVTDVTEHAVILSDTTNPIDGEFDDRLREMGREFESRMWPVIRDNYGNPLRLDDRLNGDGRFYMMFTPEVNQFGSALAFVFAGDFFPRQSDDPDQFTCASSDTAEVFYARAPTEVAPDGYQRLTQTAQWQRILRPTLVHEVKHLTAYAERLGRNVPFETTWLEESTAHMAEELYARRVFGISQGSNAQYENTVGCAVRPTGGSDEFSQCEPGTPFVLASEYVWLAQYMRNSASESPINGSVTNPIYRGAGWWLLRWAVDHAPASEPQFLQAITTSPETGIDNLEARAGRSWTRILADWTLSLAVDDRGDVGSVERTELTVPSWDVRSIYQGLHDDFGQPGEGGLFDRPYPLDVHTESYGSFTRSFNGLRGGTAGMFRLVGRPGATQLLEVTGGSGSLLPPFLRMSVVRIP